MCRTRGLGFSAGLALSSLMFFGCGVESHAPMADSFTVAPPAAADRAEIPPPATSPESSPAAGQDGASGNPESLVPENAKRVLISTATVEIVVNSIDDTLSEVKKLVEQNKGYVAASEVRGRPGSVRTASLTLRVPADEFDRVKSALLTLGTPERDSIKTDDVTEEYYDLKGRLKNLQSTQERLLELKKATDDVKRLLEIENQLDRVNEKLERIEGRLRFLSRFAALSTIQLTLREVRDYKPTTAGGFSTRVSQTFTRSWDSLLAFGQEFTLFLVALGPWLPVLIPSTVLGLWCLRRLLRWLLRRSLVPKAPPQ